MCRGRGTPRTSSGSPTATLYRRASGRVRRRAGRSIRTRSSARGALAGRRRPALRILGLNDAEAFSSRGPTVTRYLDKDGDRLATPDVRPEAGPRGRGRGRDEPSRTRALNPFFGTSAAAPSAAGVAALVLAAKPSLSVDELYAILKDPRGNDRLHVRGRASPTPTAAGASCSGRRQAAAWRSTRSSPAVAAVTAPAVPDGANGWFHSTGRAQLERDRP